MPGVLTINGTELRKEVLTFCPLPRIGANTEEFLPIAECQQLLDNGDNLATELLDLAIIRKETDKIDRASEEQKTKMARDRKITKGKN